jgi:hypothetical protein
MGSCPRDLADISVRNRYNNERRAREECQDPDGVPILQRPDQKALLIGQGWCPTGAGSGNCRAHVSSAWLETS